jgi:hypothetical protein
VLVVISPVYAVSFAERMVESRGQLGELTAKQQQSQSIVRFGPWYNTGPIAGGKFTDTSIAEQPVDLQKSVADGKAMWHKEEGIEDGEIYSAEYNSRKVEPIYLYRQIRAERDNRITMGFSAKNTIEVWLNGENILRSIRESGLMEGGLIKNQHLVELELKSGTNELLVRFFNWRGSSRFYYSSSPNPALILWQKIKKDFPLEASWFEKDLADESLEKLFAKGDNAKVEKWIDSYLRSRRLRYSLDQLKSEKEKAAKMKILAGRLVDSNAQLAKWGKKYLTKLGQFEELAKQTGVSLSSGIEEDLDVVRLIKDKRLNLLRELIVELSSGQSDKQPAVLKAEDFSGYVKEFNQSNPENIVNFIPDSLSWDWMKLNVPLFECADKNFEKIYYFRWWTLRKHIKYTEDGFVFTEFLDQVGHSGKHNTISCALGHHIYECRWLRNQLYLDDYIHFWYRGDNGKPFSHFYNFSNWTTYAAYNRYLVNMDKGFVTSLLQDFAQDFELWREKKGIPNGMFWQYDVRDGMEESISGSRHKKNVRPTLSVYMYANALAISRIAELSGNETLEHKWRDEAGKLKSLVQSILWDDEAKFFKAQYENGTLCDAREEIGFIPWYFDLPDSGYEEAWLQIKDTQGFRAPMGITTAERRHPLFRANGVGTCELDGAVWPFATSQTLVAMGNVLRNYDQDYINREDYFDAMLTYARSHNKDGRAYIGEYLDERTGQWLTPESDRSRFYNHSTFCDLVISGLCGLVPRDDNIIEVNPLIPQDSWDWFCVDNVIYHGKSLTILWDRAGSRYGKGKGLYIFSDGKEIAHSKKLERITAKLK